MEKEEQHICSGAGHTNIYKCMRPTRCTQLKKICVLINKQVAGGLQRVLTLTEAMKGSNTGLSLSRLNVEESPLQG